jgi:hypothetical protein
MPSSRPRFVVEGRRAERGVKSLFGGSKRAGPVPPGASPAASSHVQRGSRAAHVTVKAHLRPTGVPERPWSCPPGYGERHVRTAWFGTGAAGLPGPVSKDRPYEPMVKSSGGKRESDRLVVLLIAVRNVAGANGPDFGHASDGEKRKDMTETARSNHSDGHTPSATCDNSRTSYGLRPSSRLGPVLPSMTPDGVTSHLAAVERGLREGCVAMLRSPSVSCVRASRMHSSKGGCWKRSNAVRFIAGPRSER